MPSKSSKTRDNLVKKLSRTVSSKLSCDYETKQPMKDEETNGFTHPWPEWSDAYLNATKWPTVKGASTHSKTSKSSKSKSKSSSSKTSRNAEKPTKPFKAEVNCFTDSYVFEMPLTLKDKTATWKRPAEIFNGKKVILYSDRAPEYTGFVVQQQILNSKLICHIMNSINILEQIGIAKRFPVEMTTPSYVSNTTGRPWKPWHHVYAMCKSGKPHKPSFNPEGKYFVRLYNLGQWRRITVDDLIPLDSDGLPLLPSTMISESLGIELWPIILIKALIKIANLSSRSDKEIMDFNAIHCLTGWYIEEIELRDKCQDVIWDFIIQNTNQFKYQEEKLPNKGKGKNTFNPSKPSISSKTSNPSKSSKTIKSNKSSNIKSNKSSKTVKSNKSSKDSKVSKSTKASNVTDYMDAVPEYSQIRSQLIIAKLKNISKLPITDVMSNLNQLTYIIQSRNISLIKEPPKEHVAEWKYHRWIPWAIRHDLYNPSDNDPIRALQVVSCSKSRDEKTEPFVNPPPVSKKKSKKATTTIKPLADRDPHMWIHFNKIFPYIETMFVLRMPSTFSCNTKISNVLVSKQKPTKDAKKKSSKYAVNSMVNIYWPSTLSKTRNNPLYLFMDSLQEKELHISFAHLNYSVFEEVKNNIENKYITNEKRNGHPFNHTMNLHGGIILLTEYVWSLDHEGEPLMTLSTNGTTTESIKFKKGRTVLSIWIKSDTTYNIHIMSNTRFEVGSFEQISCFMNSESLQLLSLSTRISNAFQELISAFGTTQYQVKLKSFYESYSPDIKLVDPHKENDMRLILHDSFQISLVTLLMEKYKNHDTFHDKILALRVLLLNSCLGAAEVHDSDSYNDSFFSTDLYNEIQNDAATVIQSTYRGYYLKKLLSYHSLKHVNHKTIANILLTLYEEFFAPKTRDSTISKLFRNFFTVNNIFQECYNVYSDFKFTLKCLVYKGIVRKVGPLKWTPITRIVLFTHSETPCKYKIEMFCELPQYIVRVFDNDNNVEMPMVGNNVNINEYSQNLNGYTVVSYGWNEDKYFNELPWKLAIFSYRNDPLLHLCDNIKPKCNSLEVPVLITESVTNYYVPDITNSIFKCFIKIKHNTVVTLSLNTTTDKAGIRIRCISPNGTTIGEVIGQGNVVYPVLLLEYSRDSDMDMTTNSYADKDSVNTKGSDITVSKDASIIEIMNVDFRPKHLRKPKNGQTSHRKGVNSKGKRKSSISRTTSKESSFRASKESLVGDKVYVVEAILAHDTWPLNAAEWIVSENHKRKTYFEEISKEKSNESIQSKKSLKSRKSSRLKQSISKLDTSTILDNPSWLLQMAIDDTDHVSVMLDETRRYEILEMKQKWEEAEPNRLKRGQILREKYLKRLCPKLDLSSSLEKIQALNKEDPTVEPTNIKHLLEKELNLKTSVTSQEINWKTWEKLLSAVKLTGSEISSLSLFDKRKGDVAQRTLKDPQTLAILDCIPALDPSNYMKLDEVVNKRFVNTQSRDDILQQKRHSATEHFKSQQEEALKQFQSLDKQSCARMLLMNNYYNNFKSKFDGNAKMCYSTRDELVHRLREELIATNKYNTFEKPSSVINIKKPKKKKK